MAGHLEQVIDVAAALAGIGGRTPPIEVAANTKPERRKNK